MRTSSPEEQHSFNFETHQKEDIANLIAATQSDIEEIQTTTSDFTFRRALKFAFKTDKSVILVVMRQTQKTATV